MVKRGENIPEELIHYVTIHNKRDRQATANKLATNNEVMSIMYKNSEQNIPIFELINNLCIPLAYYNINVKSLCVWGSQNLSSDKYVPRYLIRQGFKGQMLFFFKKLNLSEKDLDM